MMTPYTPLALAIFEEAAKTWKAKRSTDLAREEARAFLFDREDEITVLWFLHLGISTKEKMKAARNRMREVDLVKGEEEE